MRSEGRAHRRIVDCSTQSTFHHLSLYHHRCHLIVTSDVPAPSPSPKHNCHRFHAVSPRRRSLSAFTLQLAPRVSWIATLPHKVSLFATGFPRLIPPLHTTRLVSLLLCDGIQSTLNRTCSYLHQPISPHLTPTNHLLHHHSPLVLPSAHCESTAKVY